MLGRRPQKRDKTIALLREGETSSVIMANKAHTSVAYVRVVKNQPLQEVLRANELGGCVIAPVSCRRILGPKSGTARYASDLLGLPTLERFQSRRRPETIQL